MSLDLTEGDEVQAGIDPALLDDEVPSGPPAWYPDWRGHTAVVIASGPSVTFQQIEPAVKAGTRMICVNSSYRLAPMSDVLYAADPEWWNASGGAWDFFGLKIAPSLERIQPEFVTGINTVEIPSRLIAEKQFLFPPLWGMINSGGNSGFQATNLAIQFGARVIALVGFDYKLSADGRIHHHEDHDTKLSLKNPSDPTLARWAATLDAQVLLCRKYGVRIVNCSPDSRLQSYEKMTLEEAIAL